MVLSPDGNTNFFDIVTGILQRDPLRQYLFIIYLDYVLQKSVDLIKVNGSTLKRAVWLIQAVTVSILQYGCTTWTRTKHMEKKARLELHKKASYILEHILEVTPRKTAAVRPPVSYFTNHSSKYEQDMWGTAGGVRTNP